MKTSDRGPRAGTKAKRGDSGIGSMAGELQLRVRLLKRNVKFAVWSSLPNIPMRVFAHLSAAKKIAPSKDGAIAKGPVPSAASYSLDPIAPKPVHVLAVNESDRLKQPVFNLKVEGAHEFFAEGILVHNCDAASGAFVKVTKNVTSNRKAQTLKRSYI